MGGKKVTPEPQPKEMEDPTAEQSAVQEAEAAAEEGAAVVQPVSCCELLRFATCCDKFNILFGLTITCINSCSMPLFAITLGELIHAGFMVCVYF